MKMQLNPGKPLKHIERESGIQVQRDTSQVAKRRTALGEKV
jgi:hypothetical protein